MSNASTNAKNQTAFKEKAKIFFSSKTITDLWSNTIKPNVHEEFRLLPDSLLIGSAILALATQSFSMTVFFAILLETAGLNAILQTLFGFLDRNRLLPTIAAADVKCKSGFMSPTLSTFSTLKASDLKTAFPFDFLSFYGIKLYYYLTLHAEG